MTRPGPRLGAIAVVLRRDSVLLAQRRNPPDAGLWGFPGGHVELGETALEAAARELREETGIIATPLDYLTNIDVLHRDDSGTVQFHYLLAAVLCRYDSGTPRAADDVRNAAWIPLSDLRANRVATSERVLPVTELAMARPQLLRADAQP